MKRSIRMLSLMMALMLCVSMLVACSTSEAPYDGEIGTNSSTESSGSFWDGVFGGSSSKDDAMAMPDASAPMDSPEADGDYEGGDITGGVTDGTVGGTSGGSFEHQAGQLTGSEWNDNDHFAAFVEKINGQSNGWYEIAAKWNQLATNRIHVRVHNEGDPVALAAVRLLESNGTIVYSAVTDADGDAYLFWGLNSPDDAIPATQVEVIAPNGQKVTKQVGEEREVEVEVDSVAVATKLDVMFMIDTTGSMGDELEYLKAEMGDVIRRVASEGNVSVRTSVNFYRDKGDEYELRYFDFREDVDEVVNILANQRASGGGDYEEAVDTALNYAINQSRWDEDAIKIMFLVLDAPPHYTTGTVSTINEAIKTAAEKGIRIIPVASSGVDTTCQVLFRTWAAMTGGTYTYLTNHSGIGGSHETPDVEEVNVELLNNMLVRIIKEYVVGGKQENLITPVPGGTESLIQGTKVKSIVIGTLPESDPREYASADMVARWVAWMYFVVVGNDPVEDPELPPGMIYVITEKYQDGSEQKMYFSGDFLGFGNRWYPVDNECREEFFEFGNRGYPEDGEDRVEFEKMIQEKP